MYQTRLAECRYVEAVKLFSKGEEQSRLAIPWVNTLDRSPSQSPRIKKELGDTNVYKN